MRLSPFSYRQVGGHSLERMAALSDGIFAVAMTLLVLDLHGPARQAVDGEQDLWRARVAMSPQLVAYLMSFLTLGIFWAGQQVQLSQFVRCDRHLAWIYIAFLFAISLMPFSTRLLAEFIHYRTALLCYWGNVLLLGVILFISWRYARHAGLVKSDLSAGACQAIERRIVAAQALYAFGAALCVLNTYASIGFIIAVQLNFALGLRIPWLSRF